MSCKVQQPVCSDCVTYVKSRIKFNTFNTFNNVETIKTTNKRGRRAAEGRVHKYVVPDDVHDWIRQHGGSRYITDIVRAIEAATLKAQGNPSL